MAPRHGASRVRVARVKGRADERAFLGLPYELYRRDPNWVAPLRAMERNRWRPDRNPSLRRLRVVRWLARRGGRVVGRIAAIQDPRAQRWEPRSGFFGFLDCEDDAAVAAALLHAAEARLSDWGCRTVLGPVSLTTNDEVGAPTHGFDHPTRILTPYGRPYVPGLLTAGGYEPAREYGAWEWTPDAAMSGAVARLMRRGVPRTRVRSIDPADFDAEVARLGFLYNEAFGDLWGFVPMDEAEFRGQAEAFRPFYRPELVLIAEVDAAPAAFAVLLPDANEALAGLRGRLFPLGWLLLPLRLRTIQSARFLLMGVSPTHRGRGLAPLLAARMREAVIEAGLRRVEVSLVQTANRPMVRVIEALGCERTRTFVLYRKPLLPAGRSSALHLPG